MTIYYYEARKRKTHAGLGGNAILRFSSGKLGNLGFVSTALSVRYGDVPVAEDDPYRYYRW